MPWFNDAQGVWLRHSEKKEGRCMVSFNPTLLITQAEDGNPHLLGGRCEACGKVYFPQQKLCTECFGEGTLKQQFLSCQGKIYSFTVVERETLAPKGFQVPYAYGYIDLPEGVRVLSKIVDWGPETLKIDAPVEMVLEEIRQNEVGEKIVAFRFRVI
jgi:uncharacterized protein